MTRYVSRRATQCYWFGDNEDVHEVIGMPHVTDHEPVDTELLDALGDPIMRLPNPIGFGRDEEW